MGTIALDTQYAQAPTIDVSGILVATLYATVLPAVINAAIGNTSVLQQVFSVKKNGIVSLKADVNPTIVKSLVKLFISAVGPSSA